VPTVVEIHACHGGPAKAAVAPVTAATATTERMRLIFANSCVSLVIPGGSSPTAVTILLVALCVWIALPRKGLGVCPTFPTGCPTLLCKSNPW
jgi:hypothetical protein